MSPLSPQHLSQDGERSSPFHSRRTHLQRRSSVDEGKFKGENAAVSHPADFKSSPWWDSQLPRSTKPKQKAWDALISAQIGSPAGWKPKGFGPRCPWLALQGWRKFPFPGGSVHLGSELVQHRTQTLQVLPPAQRKRKKIYPLIKSSQSYPRWSVPTISWLQKISVII